MLLAPFCRFFVNLIKKSLTICLWQDRQVDSGELRRTACGVRYSGTAGNYGL